MPSFRAACYTWTILDLKTLGFRAGLGFGTLFSSLRPLSHVRMDRGLARKIDIQSFGPVANFKKQGSFRRKGSGMN